MNGICLTATLAGASLAGAEGHAAFQRLAGRPPFGPDLPLSVYRDYDDVKIDNGWPDAILTSRSHGLAIWDPPDRQIGFEGRNNLVSVGVPLDAISIEAALALIEPLPFEICAFGSAFFDEWIAAGYKRTSFSRGHIQHGWACVFRGKGHDRLVSRRWLDFGPWRVIRRPNDTTFIQFHDLAITDQAEAHAQAWPGHERMGISDTGGFIQHIMEPLVENVRYLYVYGQRRAEIVVGPGNEVPQWDMTCARALRLYTQMNPGVPNPIDELAFIFVSEADARAHLHELWLRELECWVVDDKGKRRIDPDYHPVPNPPEWVKRLANQ